MLSGCISAAELRWQYDNLAQKCQMGFASLQSNVHFLMNSASIATKELIGSSQTSFVLRCQRVGYPSRSVVVKCYLAQSQRSLAAALEYFKQQQTVSRMSTLFCEYEQFEFNRFDEVVNLVRGRYFTIPLRSFLETQQALPTIPSVTAMILELIEAVGILHERGASHGSIKPENIFVDERTRHLVIVDQLFHNHNEEERRVVRAMNVYKQQLLSQVAAATPFSDDIYAVLVLAYQITFGFDGSSSVISSLSTGMPFDESTLNGGSNEEEIQFKRSLIQLMNSIICQRSSRRSTIFYIADVLSARKSIERYSNIQEQSIQIIKNNSELPNGLWLKEKEEGEEEEEQSCGEEQQKHKDRGNLEKHEKTLASQGLIPQSDTASSDKKSASQMTSHYLEETATASETVKYQNVKQYNLDTSKYFEGDSELPQNNSSEKELNEQQPVQEEGDTHEEDFDIDLSHIKCGQKVSDSHQREQNLQFNRESQGGASPDHPSKSTTITASQLSTTSSSSFRQLKNNDGVVVYEGGFYENEFHGFGKQFYENGSLLNEGTFEKGQLHCETGKSYYKDGTLSYEGGFSDGLLHGEGKKYDERGNLVSIGHYLHGKLNGKFTRFHENGQIQFAGFSKNNKREGEGMEYHPNGVLSFQGSYKKGKRRQGEGFDENGIKIFEGECEEDYE